MPNIHRNHTRADYESVTAVLSLAAARTLPAEAADPYYPITPEKADQMSFPTAWIQEVVWETYNGVYGPATLLKEVEHGTSECPEVDCDGTGWVDFHGDTICEDCGCVINDRPALVPEDSYTSRTGGPTAGSGSYVFFNDGSGKPAMMDAQPSEPDVQ